MPDPLKPIVKSVFVCDDVIGDPESGKITIVNLFESIRVPFDADFPYCLAKVCVFALWRGGLGKINTHVDIVQASSESLIRRTKNCTLSFNRRTDSVFTKYKIENCVFPEPGYYYVELYCEK